MFDKHQEPSVPLFDATQEDPIQDVVMSSLEVLEIEDQRWISFQNQLEDFLIHGQNHKRKTQTLNLKPEIV